MASLRQTFRVSWDGKGMVEVRTSARDTINATSYTGPTEDASTATFGLIYAALVRLGHHPPPFEEWIDLLDEVDKGATEVNGVEGPTNLAPSAGVPSLLPASPAATTGRSSKRTTPARSKPRKRSSSS